MDLADLRVFEAVARLGGMNRAATELHTVQSNVTARVRQLEEELGVTLFNRHSRGVALTPEGHRLLPFANRMATLLNEARQAVQDDGQPKGQLVIGSLETTAAVRLAPVLANYASAYPEVDLSLVVGTTEEMVARVLEHQVEGAFVCGPVSHPELDEHMVFQEDLALVTPRGMGGFAAVARVPDLKIVVLRLGCSYRQRLEEILHQRGIVGLRRLEFGTIDGMLGCVAAGLGITLLPESLATTQRFQAQVSVHRLPKGEGRVETVFIRRKDAYRSSALSAFLKAVTPVRGRVQAAG
ncbi:MAG TPA: LysR substrate-binding domain-containing protein [bacterium]